MPVAFSFFASAKRIETALSAMLQSYRNALWLAYGQSIQC
jgi:hypothetical protein